MTFRAYRAYRALFPSNGLARSNSTHSIYGITQYSYDALSRKVNQVQPDGNSQNWLYTGPAVQFTDEGNGTKNVQRISQTDGFGRLSFGL
jgi:hypothetical protein